MNSDIIIIVLTVGQVIFTLLSGLIAYIFYTVKDDVRAATRSIQELNVQLAVIVERVEHQGRSLVELNDKIKKIGV